MPKKSPYYIKEIKKPVEIVHELKDEYQIPSFEEFMKSYEVDEKIVNSYEDEINHVNVWVSKGSGPCEYYNCPCPSSCRFYLKMGFSGGDCSSVIM